METAGNRISVASPQPAPRPADGSCAEPTPSGEPGKQPERVGRVLSNLLLLSLLGVAVSVWVWFYTEWFPVVGSLLGLGGVFTWLAFLSGLLRDERKEQLQELLDRRALTAGWLVPVLLAAVVLLGLGASLFGAVVVRSTADSRDRTIAVAPPGAEPEDPERPLRRRHLPPQGERILPVWTGWGERELLVRVSGLPPRRFTLRPFERRVMEVPASFRPAIAITASPRVAANLSRFGFGLVLLLNGEEIASLEPGEYRGQEAWVGLPPDGTPAGEALVIAPDADVVQRDRLAVEVRRPRDDGVYATGTLVLPPAWGNRAVEEVELEILRKEDSE